LSRNSGLGRVRGLAVDERIFRDPKIPAKLISGRNESAGCTELPDRPEWTIYVGSAGRRGYYPCTAERSRDHVEMTMNWYLQVLKKYATFEGRARRREYWFFQLFNVLAFIALLLVDGLTGTINKEAGVGLLSGLYLLVTLIPSVAVTVRRLHDTDRSGWWLLIAFIPVLGDIALIVFACLDSQPGANRFGPNPKGVLGPGVPSPVVERP
jgi:uncharacterized membrane protein YhaH (DUF805 family)